MRGATVLRALGLAAIILGAATAFTPLANVVAARISEPPAAGPADAIVVLGGGGEWPGGELSSTALHRTTHGIALYHAGRAPLLVFSGSPPRQGRSAGVLQAELAGGCGVPSEAVITDERSRTTRDEAASLMARLRPRGVRSILLVTDAHHLVRAKRLFERQGVRVLAAPANDRAEPAQAPQARFELMNRAVQEILAVLYYRVAGYI